MPRRPRSLRVREVLGSCRNPLPFRRTSFTTYVLAYPVDWIATHLYCHSPTDADSRGAGGRAGLQRLLARLARPTAQAPTSDPRIVPRPSTRSGARCDLSRRDRRRGARRPPGTRGTCGANPPGLRDRGRARLPRIARWNARLRPRRTLRIRTYRPDRPDRRISGARAAHRLDVSRGLARPPERVRLHERASDPRQSPPSRRQAASVRRHGETGDSRDSLLHAGGSRLVAAADDERRAPAAR